METSERLEKEYQKAIDKLFDKLTRKDNEIKELKQMINKLDRQLKVLGRITDKLVKESEK